MLVRFSLFFFQVLFHRAKQTKQEHDGKSTGILGVPQVTCLQTGPWRAIQVSGELALLELGFPCSGGLFPSILDCYLLLVRWDRVKTLLPNHLMGPLYVGLSSLPSDPVPPGPMPVQVRTTWRRPDASPRTCRTGRGPESDETDWTE